MIVLTGGFAIHQFREHRPDVTLMDLQMPEMNGLDAIIAIRNEFCEARIIVLTTYKGDVQVVRALKAGVRANLLKVFAEGTPGDDPPRPCRRKAHRA